MTSQAEKIRESFKNHKWEPSRHFMDFHIAGFAYYDGLDVIDQLILGQQVSVQGARTQLNRLVAALATPLPDDPEKKLFPTPQAIVQSELLMLVLML